MILSVAHTCICLIGSHSMFTTFHLQTTGMAISSKSVFYINNLHYDFKRVT